MAEKTPEEEHAKAAYELNRQDALRTHAQMDDFWKMNNQAAIDSGTLAVKTIFLINGGAAVAMLAFIGGLAGQGRIADGDLHALANCLVWFASGVTAIGVATACAYFTNYSTAGTASSRPRVWQHPYLGPPSCLWVALRWIFQTLTIITGLAALGCFVFGMYQVKSTISEMKIIAPLADKKVP